MRNIGCLVLCTLLSSLSNSATAQIELRASADRIPVFSNLEFRITGLTDYSDPFDPAVVDLEIEFTTPKGERLKLPAFFAQDYERGEEVDGAPAGWAYPVGTGVWKARFTPSAVGKYRARAVLKDAQGERRSEAIDFESMASNRRGFVRIARQDSRFFEFDNGDSFFPVGQNLAFIGEQQYVTLRKAGEIFGRLAENGANYVRVWTGAEDWALAIEARKSAWGRSWGGKGRLVPMPDSPGKLCLLIASTNSVQEVAPSHRVALRPSTMYVVTGRVRVEPDTEVQLEVHATSTSLRLRSTKPLVWTEFRHEFTSGAKDWWLGAMRFRREGPGSVWLSDLSLTEAASSASPELLWEADMNHPARGYYNPLDCFQLDELVSSAEQRGIYLQLCMLTRDLYMNDLKDVSSEEYSRAIADAKKFFRYAIARWGYSTSVAAWEYWNEMNPGLPTDRFYTELGNFFEQSDIYHHLRRTSTWGPSEKDARHSKLDVADAHFYLRPVDKARLSNEVDAVLERTRWLRQQAPNRPVQLGEFGLADDKWRITEDMKRIPDLSDVHNGLWASTLSGASGTAMFWWWERIDQRNGYEIYRPLTQFVSDVPWNSGKIRTVDARCSDEQIRVIGLRADRRMWLWAFDTAASWEKGAVEKQKPDEHDALVIDLIEEAAFAGVADLTWWDTRSGSVVHRGKASPTNGRLRIVTPEFQRDIACQVEIRAAN